MSSLDKKTDDDKITIYNGKILVVDDEPSIRKSLKGILKRHQYKVDTAEDYASAKDTLFTEEYDALILDIILPEINGVEILHKINKKGINLPTIMLTGAPSLDTAQESVKYGAFDYLTKPVEPALLLNQLKNAVQKKRLIDARAKLHDELKEKNTELETLVEQRTAELRLSEVRYRTVVESVQDMILITNPEGMIQFANIMFLDVISEIKNGAITTTDLINKPINKFIKNLQDLSPKDIYKCISDGQEYDLITCEFSDDYPLTGNYVSSLRGIFNENLELEEVIVIISKK